MSDLIERLRSRTWASSLDDQAANAINALTAERDEALASATRWREAQAQAFAELTSLRKTAEELRTRAESAEALLAEAREELERIDGLDEAMGHDLRERHAFEAVAIARSTLSKIGDRT